MQVTHCSTDSGTRLPSEPNHYYSSIQILRGCAALAIILLHVSEMLLQYTGGHGLFCALAPFWNTGAAGVDLFFIISGFVMVQSTRNKFQLPGAGKRFIIRRFIRIIPLYWVYSTCMLLLVLFPFTLTEQIFSFTYTLQSFLFIPALNPATGLDLPLLPQGWTLSYEMYFYLIFTVLLTFPRTVFLWAITIFFGLSVLAGVILQPTGPIIKVLTSPLLLEFAAGCYLASLVDKKNIPSKAAWLLLAGGVVMLCLSSLDSPGIEYRLVYWGIPAGCITAGIVFLEKNGLLFFPGLMMNMGNSSYSTYLSHVFVLLCISTLIKRNLLPPLPNDMMAFISILLCLFLGHVSFHFVERKISSRLLRRIQ